MFFVYPARVVYALSEEHRRVSEHRTGGARAASSRRARRRHQAALCMACSEARGVRTRRVAQKGPTTRRRAANAIKAAESAPGPSARGAGVSPIPPQRPNSLSLRGLARRPKAGACLDAVIARAAAAHDATHGSRARRLRSPFIGGCLGATAQEWGCPHAAAARLRAQQHGPRVPATTRCGSRGY